VPYAGITFVETTCCNYCRHNFCWDYFRQLFVPIAGTTFFEATSDNLCLLQAQLLLRLLQITWCTYCRHNLCWDYFRQHVPTAGKHLLRLLQTTWCTYCRHNSCSLQTTCWTFSKQLFLRFPFRNLVLNSCSGPTTKHMLYLLQAQPLLRLHFIKYAAPIAEATSVLKRYILYCLVAGYLYWNIFFFSFLVYSDLTAWHGDADKCALFQVCVLDEYGYLNGYTVNIKSFLLLLHPQICLSSTPWRRIWKWGTIYATYFSFRIACMYVSPGDQ
jgi:hypothetical protein